VKDRATFKLYLVNRNDMGFVNNLSNYKTDRNMKKLFFCAILLSSLFNPIMARGPKNIIIMIGDGMGVNQVQFA